MKSAKQNEILQNLTKLSKTQENSAKLNKIQHNLTKFSKT